MAATPPASCILKSYAPPCEAHQLRLKLAGSDTFRTLEPANTPPSRPRATSTKLTSPDGFELPQPLHLHLSEGPSESLEPDSANVSPEKGQIVETYY